MPAARLAVIAGLLLAACGHAAPPSGSASAPASCYAGAAPKAHAAGPRGSLSTDEIGDVARRHSAEVRACYREAQMRDPTLVARLIFELGIGLDGRVEWSRLVSSTANDAELDGCVGPLFCAWALPPPSGGRVYVTYPVTFSPTAQRGGHAVPPRETPTEWPGGVDPIKNVSPQQ